MTVCFFFFFTSTSRKNFLHSLPVRVGTIIYVTCRGVVKACVEQSAGAAGECELLGQTIFEICFNTYTVKVTGIVLNFYDLKIKKLLSLLRIKYYKIYYNCYE